MNFKRLRRFKKTIAVFLLLNIVIEIAIPLKSFSNTNNVLSSMGSSPISTSTSGMVDGYTGDFSYGVPLISLPGPNGENVSISAGYGGGIMVNQKSSWMGLGWDFNPGEISRQVVDAPDDYYGKPVLNMKPFYNINYKYGALYNNKINETPAPYTTNPHPTFTPLFQLKSCDIVSSDYVLSSTERYNLIHSIPAPSAGLGYGEFDADANSSYRFNNTIVPHKQLAYDNYQVSGALNGSLKLAYLGGVNLHGDNFIYKTGLSVNNRKAQFYFNNSFNQSIDGSNYTNNNFVNSTTNQIHSGTYVKYYTNAEINDNSNLYNNTNNTGYLDYKPITNLSVVRRPSSVEDPNLIGAFQVTDASGMTYHYSLPVYSISEFNYRFGDDFSSTFSGNVLNDKYASSWKLTSVTGQDYQDANNNFTPDEGDTGYWISYNYSLWSSNFAYSSQRFGFKSDLSLTTKSQNFVSSSAVGNRYFKTYSNFQGHSEVYNLNYIKTATHTAYFIKGIRKDEQSIDNLYNPLVKPTALLKLERIVLLKNENKSLLENLIPLSGADLDSRFNYITCNSALTDVNFVNITRYNANKTLIDDVALKTIEFNYDYSLAKKYTGNINNSFISTGLLNTQIYRSSYANEIVPLYFSATNFSTTDLANSGKLTLKKINIYDLKAQKITPSIDFGYDENNIIKNPDFNQDKTDLWGYYKNDYVNSHYVTSISKNDVDAWSLKEINTSLGGKIQVEYESDVYFNEGFSNEPAFKTIVNGGFGLPTQIPMSKPHIIFPISSVVNDNTSQMTFQDYDFYAFYHNLGEPIADPSYFHNTYLVTNWIDGCNPVSVTYYGYTYTPDATKRLIRRGKFLGESPIPGAPAPSTYSNGPFSYFLVGMTTEYDLICSGGAAWSSVVSNGYGVNFAISFREFLYGGGVRVKNIKVIDPVNNETFTQEFSYVGGYCPVVPKSMDLSSTQSPSNFDVVFNSKPSVYPSINSKVGYDIFSQKSIGLNGENLGTVEQTFSNYINNPITLASKNMYRSFKNRCSGCTFIGGNSAVSCHNVLPYPCTPTGPTTPTNIWDYQISFNTCKSNAGIAMLGKTLSSVVYNKNGVAVSQTNYGYENTIFVKEKYIATEIVTREFPIRFTMTGCGYSSGYGALFENIQKDIYYYGDSESYNYNANIRTISTTKDGITIFEDIELRDPYTGAPVRTKITDPTKGIYTNITDLAYINSGLYPSFGLKTKNITNRNLPSLTEQSTTLKSDKYVISQSIVNYTNQFPTRNFSPISLKYQNSNLTKPWFRLYETYTRLLDSDVELTIMPSASDWRKTSLGTLYDLESNRIEEEGLANRKAASKWGYNNKYKLASISNANYNSFAFTGFEDQQVFPLATGSTTHFGGEVTNGQFRSGPISASSTLITPHTGFYMANLPPNQLNPSFETSNFEVGRTYIAKVWVHNVSPNTAALSLQLIGTTGPSGTPININKTITKASIDNMIVGNWTLLSTEIDVPENFNLTGSHSLTVKVTNIGSTTNAFFDDLAFHPKDAVMSGNVYNEKTGLLVAQLDNENLATLYNYDNAGRIITTYKEFSGGMKKITENTYHFAKP